MTTAFMMWIFVILLCTSVYPSYGAKILGVLVTESKSDFYAIRNVADELASRGHQVCKFHFDVSA